MLTKAAELSRSHSHEISVVFSCGRVDQFVPVLEEISKRLDASFRRVYVVAQPERLWLSRTQND